MRVVRTPGGALEIDETGRAAGRGAYLCRDGACSQTAIDKGALSRALRTPLPAALKAALQTPDTNTTSTMSSTTGGEQRGEE